MKGQERMVQIKNGQNEGGRKSIQAGRVVASCFNEVERRVEYEAAKLSSVVVAIAAVVALGSGSTETAEG